MRIVETLTERIATNLAQVWERVFEAAGQVGRDPGSIRLVSVTKAHPPQLVRAAYMAGIRVFGENRPEEAIPKIEALEDLEGLEWHMVGHIQSRKAKLVPPHFDLVHSVDRMKIARLLDRNAAQVGRRLPVLLQCNVSGEETKSGWSLVERERWSDVLDEFAQLVALPNLELRGLMTIAPWTEDEQVLRRVFRKLRGFRDYLEGELGVNWPELSMGMTDDFEIAVEEGATLLRIGRAIFGPRPGDHG